MRDFTNLGWPEAPFGADHRAFGKHSDMLAACAVEWAEQPDAGPLPVCASIVYLRVRRLGSPYVVSANTLSVGFRATVIESAAEMPDLLALVDRALIRARRHAAILAGHRLDDDLSRMVTLSTASPRGSAAVLAAWADRRTREPGVALMVDTGPEASAARAHLDMPLDPLPVPTPNGVSCCASVARSSLNRCLAIGLTAAVHAGRYEWEGTFPVGDAMDRAAWDVLSDANNG